MLLPEGNAKEGDRRRLHFGLCRSIASRQQWRSSAHGFCRPPPFDNPGPPRRSATPVIGGNRDPCAKQLNYYVFCPPEVRHEPHSHPQGWLDRKCFARGLRTNLDKKAKDGLSGWYHLSRSQKTVVSQAEHVLSSTDTHMALAVRSCSCFFRRRTSAKTKTILR